MKQRLAHLWDGILEGPGAWKPIAMVCVTVAMASLLFNMTTPVELDGQVQAWSFVRKSITKVVNSGTVWAAVAVYAGSRLPRLWQAFVGGITAAVAALLIHYGVGTVVDFITGPIIHLDGSNDLLGNLNWFITALVACGPLGLVGWLATQPGWSAVVARSVVPVGAILEPFVMRRFVHPFQEIPWPERYSDTVSGIILIAAGLVGLGYLAWQSAHQRPTTNEGATTPPSAPTRHAIRG